MRKKVMNILTCLCLIVVAVSANVIASSGSGSVTVPDTGASVCTVIGATRTGNYSYVKIKADSVTPIPPYIIDNYTRCKTKVYKNDNTATPISNQYTLTEGADYTKVYINEGYLSLRKFNINFKGNTNGYAAVIYYHYQGL